MKRSLFHAVIPLIAILAAGHSTVAATYYLAPGGDDKNPGSEASPWGTFPYAANHLQPGDTLLVRQGTYSWKMYTNISSGSSWAQAVTIKTYPGETATFQSPAGPQYIRLSGDRQYIIIEGQFIFDGVGISLESARFVRLKDLEAKNGKGTAAIGGGDDCEFINLNVHHNGKGGLDHGIYSHGDRNLIDGGQWHHNSGWGIHNQAQGTKHWSENWIIRNAEVYENGGGGIHLNTGEGHKIYNNVIRDHGGTGLTVHTADTLVMNNTFVRNMRTGIVNNSATLRVSKNALVANNIFWENRGEPVRLEGDAKTTAKVENNLVDSDPLFANSAACNFRLMPGSPAINAGVTLKDVTADRASTARPQEKAYDIGAYEYAGARPPIAAPVGLAATPGQAKVDLTWKPVAGAAGYNVYRRNVGSGAIAYNVNRKTPAIYAVVHSGAATSWQDTGLSNGTTYYYVVSALAAGGEAGPNSAVVSAVPRGPAGAPLGWWKFDESSGETAADSSGNGYDGTVMHGTWQPTKGRSGGAVLYEGKTRISPRTKAVELQTTATIVTEFTEDMLSAKFTYAAWIYPTGWGKKDMGRIFSHEFSTNASYFAVTATGTTLTAAVRNTDGGFFASAASSPVSLNAWHHVAFTYDDAGDRKIHIYLDGAEVGYSSQQAVTGTFGRTHNVLTIGNNANGTGAFAGMIDDARVYDCALSEGDIARLVAKDKTTQDKPLD